MIVRIIEITYQTYMLRQIDQLDSALSANRRPFLAPFLHEPMEAVVGGILSQPAQFLKQPLVRMPHLPLWTKYDNIFA